MKKLSLLLIMLLLLTSCSALSSVARQSVEKSSTEYTEWVALFKDRLQKTPDQDIAPFTIWVIGVIGDDKERLPREAERLVDEIYNLVINMPDDHIYTKRERAKLLGAWDRIFVILYEEAAKKGVSLIKKLAGVVL